MKGLGNQDTGGAIGGMGPLNLERSPGEGTLVAFSSCQGC